MSGLPMEQFWILLLISVSLAMDCLAVSLGIGSLPIPCTPRSIFRISFHFGLFQGLMTFLGWLVGSTVVQWIAGFDHWVALMFLGWIGLRMILEGLSRQDKKFITDPTRGSSLVMLSVATSIDALGVGLSFALIGGNIPSASLLVGLVSAIFSVFGMLTGKRLSQRFGKGIEVIGGIILIFIGLRIVVTHTIG